MKLTICYLCVLTVLCVIPICLTTLGLVSKYWIRYSLEMYIPVPTGANGQSGDLQVLTMTMDINCGLDKTNYCTKLPQPGAPTICADVSNDAFASIFKWGKQMANSTDKKESASADVFLQNLNDAKDTLRTVKVLTIFGLVAEVAGTILALTFWRRGYQTLVMIRWLLCALCWFVAGIVLLASTIMSVPLNEEQRENFQTIIDQDKAEKVEKLGPAADKLPQDSVTGHTAWAILFAGLAFAHSFVTGIFVLLARCFQLPSHKYSPISLVSYEKSKPGNKSDTANLMSQHEEEGSDEGSGRVHMQAEYHD